MPTGTSSMTRPASGSPARRRNCRPTKRICRSATSSSPSAERPSATWPISRGCTTNPSNGRTRQSPFPCGRIGRSRRSFWSWMARRTRGRRRNDRSEKDATMKFKNRHERQDAKTPRNCQEEGDIISASSSAPWRFGVRFFLAVAFLLAAIPAVASAQTTQPADSNLESFYNHVRTSLVGVKYQWQGELAKQEVVGCGRGVRGGGPRG